MQLTVNGRLVRRTALMCFTFTSANVVGNTSNAIATVSTSDDTATMNTAFEDTFDNLRIETGADGILDFSETNPFGEP